MITTKQKPIADTQKRKRKECNYTATENQIIKETAGEDGNKGIRKQPENNEQNSSKYIIYQ